MKPCQEKVAATDVEAMLADADDFISPAEASEIVRLRPQTLANWRKDKRNTDVLPYYKVSGSPGKPGGRVYYRRSECLHFVAVTSRVC